MLQAAGSSKLLRINAGLEKWAMNSAKRTHPDGEIVTMAATHCYLSGFRSFTRSNETPLFDLNSLVRHVCQRSR